MLRSGLGMVQGHLPALLGSCPTGFRSGEYARMVRCGIRQIAYAPRRTSRMSSRAGETGRAIIEQQTKSVCGQGLPPFPHKLSTGFPPALVESARFSTFVGVRDRPPSNRLSMRLVRNSNCFPAFQAPSCWEPVPAGSGTRPTLPRDQPLRSLGPSSPASTSLSRTGWRLWIHAERRFKAPFA